VCLSLFIGRQRKRIKKKAMHNSSVRKMLFRICIHSNAGIMDVLQGRLASASESLGELTLSQWIIDWCLKFNQI